MPSYPIMGIEMRQVDLEELLGRPRTPRQAAKAKQETKANNKNRQTLHRQKMYEAGYRQVNVWLPDSHAADFQLAAEQIRADPDLALGPLRRISTGKLERLRK